MGVYAVEVGHGLECGVRVEEGFAVAGVGLAADVV